MNMADDVDLFIGEVHAELCRSMVCGNAKQTKGRVFPITTGMPVVCYSIGGGESANHHAKHHVSWIEFAGKTETSESSSTEDDVSFTDSVSLRVIVQSETKESCRKLWQNIRLAGTKIAGDQISWGDSTSPSEEKNDQLGSIYEIKADATLKLTVHNTPAQLPGFPSPLGDYVYREVLKTTDQTLQSME